MERTDWNLLVLSAAEGKDLTPAQFQKAVFLLQKKYPNAIPAGYSFRAYNYGPFDPDVYKDAEKLEDVGLVQIRRTMGGLRLYAATDEGLERSKKIAAQANPEVLDYAKKVVHWARSLTFPQLIRSIYEAYPEMKINSIFRDSR